MKNRFEALVSHIEQQTAWSGGIHRPWEGSALLEPDQLLTLVCLAAYAPENLVKDVLAGKSLGEIV